MEQKENKSIALLKKIGFLIRYNDLELYHGRMQGENENWFVRSDVDNSYDKNRNNIMGVACLCVASYPIAESYAKGATLGGQSGKMRIHEIVAKDEESLIVNEKFDVNKLSEKDDMKFCQAIQSITKGALRKYCLSLDGGEDILKYIIDNDNDRLISETEEESIISDKEALRANINVVHYVIGAVNSNLYFQKLPLFTISSYVFDHDDKREFVSAGGQKYRINQDFVRSVLDRNNIIALNKKSLVSDKDNIVYVFNLDKVQTAEKLGNMEK